jgi:hypothetical protein
LDLELCINDTFSNYQPYNHDSQYTRSSTYFMCFWLHDRFWIGFINAFFLQSLLITINLQ